MTPQEFAVRMRQIFKVDEAHPEGTADDLEAAHREADALMGDILSSFGYKEGVDVFVDAGKWYA